MLTSQINANCRNRIILKRSRTSSQPSCSQSKKAKPSNALTSTWSPNAATPTPKVVPCCATTLLHVILCHIVAVEKLQVIVTWPCFFMRNAHTHTHTALRAFCPAPQLQPSSEHLIQNQNIMRRHPNISELSRQYSSSMPEWDFTVSERTYRDQLQGDIYFRWFQFVLLCH